MGGKFLGSRTAVVRHIDNLTFPPDRNSSFQPQGADTTPIDRTWQNGRNVRSIWSPLPGNGKCLPDMRYSNIFMGLAPGLVAMAVAGQASADANAELFGERMAEGEVLYRRLCARCHGDNGQGQGHDHDAAPRLKGSKTRLSVQRITMLVTSGGAYMTRFSDLTDREVAAVATYVRNSFGNRHGMATEIEVSSHR